VKRSVERALHPTTPSLSSSFYAGIVGYDAYTQGKAEHLAGVTVLGRYDVVFQLSEPDPAFLSMMAVATMKPVCVSGGDRYVDTWMPCGAGPFKLEPGGWVRGTSLRLVRHDAYFRPGLPYLDAVEWQFGVTTMAQRFRFEQGELDLWLNPTGADPGRFAADARWKGLSVSLAQNIVWGEAMNTRMAPFDNIEVRRAVAAAINRNEAAMLQPANIAPMTQLLPRDTPGYEPDFPGQRYDEAAALEHMRKAGYPFDAATGKGGWPSPVVYTVTYPNFPSSWAEVLQQQLARIGIRLQLRLVTQNAYLAITQRAGSSAMHPQGDGTDYPDPSAFFEPLFTTAAIAPEGTSNTAYYSNPRYDDLVARARHEPDEAVRRALYHEANVLLCDEAPWAFSYGQHDYVMRQPYVRNFAMHPVWPFDVRDVWLDPPSATLPGPLGARPQ
jgi:ABC-type transport system substrate-binding protein